jgi:NAD+ diphosphatase
MSPRPDLGPKPRLGYTASAIDRASEKRNDEAFLRTLMADERAGSYAIAGEMVVLKAGDEVHDPMFRPDEVAALGPQTETVFLGLIDGAGRFGVGLDPGAVEPLKGQNRFFITDLRSIAMQGLVAHEHLPPLAEAKAMLHWHARHRFCSNCGAPSTLTEAGWRRDCPTCKATHFPRTDPVVIMLAIDGDRCLLGRQTRFVKGMWSCLAGFVEPGETIEEAVRRETREEAGITCGRVRYFATQPWPFPMSLMIGCHAEALTTDIAVDTSELEDARWFNREEAAQMLLRRHPVKLGTPPPVAIAYHIIRAFVEEGDAVLR